MVISYFFHADFNLQPMLNANCFMYPEEPSQKWMKLVVKKSYAGLLPSHCNINMHKYLNMFH